MKNHPYRFLLWIAIPLLALAVALFFVNVWAPLLLLLSVAIQLPIIFAVTRMNNSGSYRQRNLERRAQYQQDGDAEAFLAAEQAETATMGYRHWSSGAKDLCALTQAELLAALGRGDEAAVQLAEIKEGRLSAAQRQRFDETVAAICAAGEAENPPAAPPVV